MITQAEREEWFRDAVTQDFLRQLQDTVIESQFRWSSQAYVDFDHPERSMQLNLYALAGVDVLRQVISMVEENRPQQREVD